MIKRSTLVITIALASIFLVSSPADAAKPLEGSLKSFLGDPRIDLQQVFEDERYPNIVVTLEGCKTAGFRWPKPLFVTQRWTSWNAQRRLDLFTF